MSFLNGWKASLNILSMGSIISGSIWYIFVEMGILGTVVENYTQGDLECAPITNGRAILISERRQIEGGTKVSNTMNKTMKWTKLDCNDLSDLNSQNILQTIRRQIG